MPSSRVAVIVQHPAAGKTHPVPYSVPGRSHVLPPCPVGPQARVAGAPAGAGGGERDAARTADLPDDLRLLAVDDRPPSSARAKNSAHSEPDPCISLLTGVPQEGATAAGAAGARRVA